jgi:hypothetical protein
MNEFLQGDKISVNTISKKCLKSLDAPAFSLPRHNLSHQLPNELPADLSTRLIWVRRSSIIPLSTPSTTAPTPSSARDPALSPSTGLQEEIIVVSYLQAFTAVDATPGSP